MKSHNAYCVVIGLALLICTSNVVFYDSISFNQNDQSLISPISSADEFPFDTGELNWTSEFCFFYKSNRFFHFTIQCFITELKCGYQFNFTYHLEINSTHNENSSYSPITINGDFLLSALFEVKFIHDEYIDIGYLYIPKIDENTTLINDVRPLILFQDEIPRGYTYRNTVFFDIGYDRKSKSYIFTLNPKELQSNYDGKELWVQNVNQFIFKTNFHFNDLVFRNDFCGNYAFYLGDGIHSANSSAEMLYNFSTSFSPSELSAFNISITLGHCFESGNDGIGYETFSFGASPIKINQTNYNETVFQNFTERTEINVHDHARYANNTPFTFDLAYPTLHIDFQLDHYSREIEFELPIRQVQFDEEETSSDTETPPGSFIIGFPCSFLAWISVISVLCIIIQVLFRKNHHHSKNS